MFVVKVVEYILRSLSYDEHTIQLGKVAGLLHDIGSIYGRYDHARTSAVMCASYYGKNDLTNEDWNIIQKAILDHSSGNEIDSAVGAALLIADKIDMSKNRGLSVKEDLRISGCISKEELNKWDDWYDIDDIEINITNNIITFNFLMNSSFSALWNNHNKMMVKAFSIIEKASAYLNCKCNYKVNGVQTQKVNEGLIKLCNFLG